MHYNMLIKYVLIIISTAGEDRGINLSSERIEHRFCNVLHFLMFYNQINCDVI